MNILVYKNYTVNDHSKWYNDRTDEGDIQNSYTQMEELSVASAEAYVQDLDEIKVSLENIYDDRETIRNNKSLSRGLYLKNLNAKKNYKELAMHLENIAQNI